MRVIKFNFLQLQGQSVIYHVIYQAGEFRFLFKALITEPAQGLKGS